MKILFINSNQFKQPWPVMPIGLLTTATYTKQKGHEVAFLDLCFKKNSFKALKKKIEIFEPNIIAVGVRNIDNAGALNILFLLENVRKKVITPLKDLFAGPIIIGGTAVGINPKEILEYFDLKYAIVGDGEETVDKFSKFIKGELPIEKVDGLVHRENSKIVIENKRACFNAFGEVPIFPYELIDIKQYLKYGYPLQIQTKRGCPLNCSYCTYNKIEGKEYRFKKPEVVVEELKSYVLETGKKSIEFTDSTFNIPVKHTKEILRLIKKSNLKLKLRTMGLNPASVDEELVSLMKDNNFTEVDLGIESVCEETLRGLNKNYLVEDIFNAVKILQKYDIAINFYLLLGAPNETRETVNKTLENINRIAKETDFINFAIGIRVYNGSPLGSAMELKADRINTNQFFRPYAYEPQNISLKEIRTIVKEMSYDRANYFIYEEDENTPTIILGIGVFIFRLLFEDLPIWRILIFKNKVLHFIGVKYILKLLHRLNKDPLFLKR